MIDILSLPNWSVINVERGDTCVIHAQFAIRPEYCVKCGSTSDEFLTMAEDYGYTTYSE